MDSKLAGFSGCSPTSVPLRLDYGGGNWLQDAPMRAQHYYHRHPSPLGFWTASILGFAVALTVGFFVIHFAS
jgi:hypothetical protein